VNVGQSRFIPADDFAGKAAVIPGEAASDRQASSRLEQAFPNPAFIGRQGAEQEALNPPSRRPPSAQPRRQHRRVVAEKRIARGEVRGQIREPHMQKRARPPIDHQQPRPVPPLRRHLRNPLLGQFVVEEIGRE
jgi:hypothetical protein